MTAIRVGLLCGLLLPVPAHAADPSAHATTPDASLCTRRFIVAPSQWDVPAARTLRRAAIPTHATYPGPPPRPTALRSDSAARAG